MVTPSANGVSRYLLQIVLAGVLFGILLLALLIVARLRASHPEQEEVYSRLGQHETAQQQPTAVPMVEVLVPVKEIQQGEQLLSALFTRVLRPANNLPANVIRSIDEVQGKFARTSLSPLEPFTPASVSKDQPINILADSIPNGYRAVTISVDATTGVEGWASPGAVVDVQWISDAIGQRAVILLVQNAKVLSAERQVDPAIANPDPSKPIPTTITLMVPQRDAQKISLAAAAGTLVLHLRGEDEGKASTVGGAISLGDVLGNGKGSQKKTVEGVVKVRRPDGTYEEMAVVNGRQCT